MVQLNDKKNQSKSSFYNCLIVKNVAKCKILEIKKFKTFATDHTKTIE